VWQYSVSPSILAMADNSAFLIRFCLALETAVGCYLSLTKFHMDPVAKQRVRQTSCYVNVTYFFSSLSVWEIYVIVLIGSADFILSCMLHIDMPSLDYFFSLICGQHWWVLFSCLFKRHEKLPFGVLILSQLDVLW
jgi:hypothetical protein